MSLETALKHRMKWLLQHDEEMIDIVKKAIRKMKKRESKLKTGFYIAMLLISVIIGLIIQKYIG